jgi:pyruvate/2-oxoglutarate dehydrogenase complex dihydrolipoamide acyltransferase (E2) component
MSMDIKAPQFPESVAEGTVAHWHKRPGDVCRRDEVLVDIETDKVVLEVVAPADGSVSEILKDTGETVLGEEIIGRFTAGAVAPTAQTAAVAARDEGAALPRSGPCRAPTGGSRAWVRRRQQISGHRQGGASHQAKMCCRISNRRQPPAQPVPAVSTATSPRAAEPRRRGTSRSDADRKARADDPAARAASPRRLLDAGAADTGDADHVQRSQHAAGDGSAHQVSASSSRSAQRDAARFHVLLRARERSRL